MNQVTRIINQTLYLSECTIKAGSKVELLSAKIDHSFATGVAVTIKVHDPIVNEFIVEVDSGYFSSIG